MKFIGRITAFIDKESSGLPKDSTAIVSQVSAIDKARLSEKIGTLKNSDIQEIDDGLRLILSL